MNDQQNITWTQWLNSLTPDDASALLSKMKKMKLKARQRLFKQGECDNRLIFIESGKLKLCYWDRQKKKNIVFTHLSQGDIFGADTFFSHSPHTGTLSAVDDVVIRCLYKNDYQKLLSACPDLEKKLIEYCEKNQKKIVFHKEQKFARRQHERYDTSLNGQIHLYDATGNISPIALIVNVSNISAGGLCSSVKNLSVEDASKYYQSKVQLTLSYEKNSMPCKIEKLSKVVAVRFKSFGESTIHLQFNIPLTEKQVREIVKPDNVYTYT